MDPRCDLFPNFLEMIRCSIFTFGVFMFDFLDFNKVWKSSMMPERSLRKYSNELVFPGGKFPPQRTSYILRTFPKETEKNHDWLRLAPPTFRQEYGAYVLGFRLLGKAAGEYLFRSYTHRFMGV